VGIGSTAPGAALDINGFVRVANGNLNVTNGGSVNYLGATNASGNGLVYIQNSAGANQVYLNSSGASFLNGGNVGIASTTPADTLDVNGNVFRNGDRFHMALPNLTTAAWYKLGTWTATNQGGRAELLFHATNGYGGTAGTSGMTHLVMSMLNQLSTPNITGYFWSEGGVPIITDIRASTAASCSSNGQTCQSWDIYGFIQTFAGPNDNFYEVKTGSVGTWTNSMTANTPTGTVGTTQIILSNSMSFSSGNVGIGTTAPSGTLEVRGTVKLHTDGSLYAPGGVENLRIVRGTVNADGTIGQGSGFSVSRTSTGQYTVTFTTAFSAEPTVTLTTYGNASDAFNGISLSSTVIKSASQFGANITNPGSTAFRDIKWEFIAIGPR
jgi:hypothetical protein